MLNRLLRIAEAALGRPLHSNRLPLQPFDLAAFLKQEGYNPDGWRMWPRRRTSMYVEVMGEIDLANVILDSCLDPSESHTTFRERIARLDEKYPDKILLGPEIIAALRQRPEKFPEYWKQDDEGGLFLQCDGQTILNPEGDECAIAFCWWYGRIIVSIDRLHSEPTDDGLALEISGWLIGCGPTSKRPSLVL